MTDLVALAGEEPSIQNHLNRIITSQQWSKVYLIAQASDQAPAAEQHGSPTIETVHIDFTLPIKEVIEALVRHLKPRLTGTEVGLNLIAGNGKQHMAVLSAVLQCGVGFRLVALTKEGVVEI